MDGERIYGLTEPVLEERREYGVHRWQLTSGEMVTGLLEPIQTTLLPLSISFNS